MTEGTRRRGPSALLGTWVIIAGLVMVPLGLVLGFQAVDGDLVPTPVSSKPIQIVTRKGTYYVYETFSRAHENPPAMGADQVQVRAYDGTEIPTAPANSDDFIGNGSSEARPSVKFTTPKSGLYVISATSSLSPEVRRAGFERLDEGMLWFRVAGAGVLAIVGGFVLLIVGRARRRAPRLVTLGPPAPPAFTIMPASTPGGSPVMVPTGPPAGSPPGAAGWYPDPWRQATWRYHDGSTWTSHLG